MSTPFFAWGLGFRHIGSIFGPRVRALLYWPIRAGQSARRYWPLTLGKGISVLSELLLWFAVLAASLAVLLKGADIFVEQASGLARTLGVPEIIIGVSLVALGTSLPELAAALASVFTGEGEFVAGTVVGSNVANVCFILGTAALAFKGFSVSGQMKRLDLPVLVASALVLSLMLMDGSVSMGEGIILLAMYGIYISQTLRQQAASDQEPQGKFRPIVILWLVLGGAAVYFGAEYTVKAVTELTVLLGLADTSLLALTVVAVGSSLPELVVTLTAAKKQYFDLAVGNVVGSNICNSFLVAGLPALVKPLPSSDVVGKVGLPFMLAATLLFFVMSHTGRVSRHSGVLLLLIFVLFLGKTVGLF